MILKGKKVDTKVVLDKKSHSTDKFDDLKIIEGKSKLEIQLKHRELKQELDLSDFINYSSDFSLFEFIRSYLDGLNTDLCLIVSMKNTTITDKLLENIEKINENTIISTEKYKFKKSKDLINKLYENRISKNGKSKINFSDITKDDISKFIDVFRFEITSASFANEGIKNMIFNEISDDVEKLSNIPKNVIYKYIVETIREYRAEDTYAEVSINDIKNIFFDKLRLVNFTIPVNNDMRIDYNYLISRKKDIDSIMKMFENCNLVHVIGQPGVGKSWFSKEFSDYLNESGVINSTYYFYFNFDDIDRKKRLTKLNFIAKLSHLINRFKIYSQ